jgi:myo-inositol-1(or 4)-monophosphatase
MTAMRRAAERQAGLLGDGQMSAAPGETKQLLHLVFGGELEDLASATFADLSKLDIVGMYPNYKAAYDAWKGAAQRTVDNARTRYFIVHVHRLLDPETGGHIERE